MNSAQAHPLHPDALQVVADHLRGWYIERDKLEKKGLLPDVLLVERIMVFEYILLHSNADQLAEDFLNKIKDIYKTVGRPIPVREINVARSLGWFQ